jgi:membrane protease YdiL (CAAX protease family)
MSASQRTPSTFLNIAARLALVTFLTLAAMLTLMLDQVLRHSLANLVRNGIAADLLSWAARLLVWMAPLLLTRRSLGIGSLRLRPTWAVWLVLPYAFVNIAFFRGFPADHFWVQIIWVAVGIGCFEELVFRGYALARCDSHPRLAIFLSALGFTFLHAGYPWGNIVLIFFTGIAFGVLRVVSGSLGWCILIHALVNYPSAGAEPPPAVLIPVAALTSIATVVAFWRLPRLQMDSRSGRWWAMADVSKSGERLS